MLGLVLKYFRYWGYFLCILYNFGMFYDYNLFFVKIRICKCFKKENLFVFIF